MTEAGFTLNALKNPFITLPMPSQVVFVITHCIV